MSSRLGKIGFTFTLIAAALAGISACSKSSDAPAVSTEIVRVDGSSTVFPITEAIAEEFQRESGIRVTVGISGTGGGFKKFCRGEVDITQASRPILDKEIAACKEAGIEYVELPVAYDALTVVINPDNTFIQSLSVEELKAMWQPSAQDQIKTWNQVNPAWPDKPLKLFGAGSDSGTFDYFTEAIVGKAKSSRGDFTASEDDNVVVQGVAGDVNALGYFGFAYYEENKSMVKAVPIRRAENADAVMPSEKSVMDGSYQPLSRPLFLYVKAAVIKDKPEAKAFVDFYLNNATDLVKEVKFIPLPQEELDAVVAHWQAGKVGTGFGGVPEVGIKIQELLKRI
ncbi:PstS family phosphate ABC transporter substrate-binding protein [Methylobacillus flagellatus]|uniref:PstS family phosphate ABC transporter substrate-binding protein n=1 Tax=Methylobacillus flagellatus TaxID=405 RepID=UPI0010F7C8C2|nr:PstS family phosphate ABC transporter substrate-binding protein [Methylobacillus flagellatus]